MWKSPLCLGVVSLTTGVLSQSGPHPLTANLFDQLECPVRADFTLAYGAETFSETGDFNFLVNDLEQSREYLGYTDAIIETDRMEAEDLFFERFGVDFRNRPMDPSSGTKMSEDGAFMMGMMRNNAGLRAWYTSEHGDLTDCPIPIMGEGWGFVALTGAPYFGTYGGLQGKASSPGDPVFYANYILDLDGDGMMEALRFISRAPMRTTDGVTHLDCEMISDKYGLGRSQGTGIFTADRASVRTLMTFPARYETAVPPAPPATPAPMDGHGNMCPATAEFSLAYGAERFSELGDFNFLVDDLAQSREILGFTDEDILADRLDAEDLFAERFGVDFREQELQADGSGSKLSPDGKFTMGMMRNNVDLRAWYSSLHGDLTDCPVPIYGEGWVLLGLTEDARYFGTYGGVEGKAATPGDPVFYANYMMDLERDGSYEPFRFISRSPFRTVDGVTNIDCDVITDSYGFGRSQGTGMFTSDRASVRTLMTFPARYGVPPTAADMAQEDSGGRRQKKNGPEKLLRRSKHKEIKRWYRKFGPGQEEGSSDSSE